MKLLPRKSLPSNLADLCTILDSLFINTTSAYIIVKLQSPGVYKIYNPKAQGFTAQLK